jgi:hypothetical protein
LHSPGHSALGSWGDAANTLNIGDIAGDTW